MNASLDNISPENEDVFISLIEQLKTKSSKKKNKVDDAILRIKGKEFFIPQDILSQVVMLLKSTLTPETDKEISPKEAAKILNITEDNVHYLLESKQLQFRKKGKTVLISSKSVLEYDRQETIRQEKEMEKLVRMSEELKLY
jgi:excisionase family DNA binding protein